MDIHHAVRNIVDHVGVNVLDDADNFRGVLDDVLDEHAADAGEVNLLVDAVRFGAVAQLVRLLDTDADPRRALATVGAGLARLRGGADAGAASWACAVLGFAMGRVPEEVVRELAARRPPPLEPAATRLPPPRTATRPGDRTVSANPMVETVRRPGAGSATAPPHRWRGRIGLLVAVTVVAAGIGGGVAAIFAERGGRDDSAAGAGPTPPIATTAAEREPMVSDDTIEPTGDVQCWNGERAGSVAACGVPTNVRGLAWVFPSSDDDGCDPPTGKAGATRIVDRFCAVSLADGGGVQVHYSQWRRHDWMVENYEAERVGPNLAPGRADVRAFEVGARENLAKFVLFYRDSDAPFAVTVYAQSVRHIVRAVAKLRIRPVDQLPGLEPDHNRLPTAFRVDVSPTPR